MEIPKIFKQIDKAPEIRNYKDLNAKFVTMKNEIYELKSDIKNFKEGIEKTNSKSSPDKNYSQELNIKNHFSEQQNSFLNKKLYQNRALLTNFLISNQIN